MHDDKYSLIGMSEEDMWKQDESKNGVGFYWVKADIKGRNDHV